MLPWGFQQLGGRQSIEEPVQSAAHARSGPTRLWGRERKCALMDELVSSVGRGARVGPMRESKARSHVSPRSSISPQTPANRRDIPDAQPCRRRPEKPPVCSQSCSRPRPSPSACHAEGRGFESLQPLSPIRLYRASNGVSAILLAAGARDWCSPTSRRGHAGPPPVGLRPR
jgi:hypothetical protein